MFRQLWLGAAMLLALAACSPPAQSAHVPGVPFACEMTLDQAKAKVAAFHPVTTWEIMKGKPFDAVVAFLAKNQGADLSTTTMMIVTRVEGVPQVFIAFTSSEDCLSEDWLWSMQVQVFDSLVGAPL